MKTGKSQPDDLSFGERLALALLEWVDSPDRIEVLGDIREEVAERKLRGTSAWKLAAWKIYQLTAIVFYAFKDNGSIIPAHSLHPVFAFRLAFRSFRHEFASAATAALTLAVGFGAAAAIFSVMTGFSRPLPVPGGERIVRVSARSTTGELVTIPPQNISRISARQTTFATLGVFHTRRSVVLSENTLPVRVSMAAMSHEVFSLLQVQPMAGRLPGPDADRLDESVVVISQGFAEQLQPRGQPLIGSTIRVDGRARDIIGIMPAGFGFPLAQDLWIPLNIAAEDEGLEIVGRLADGVSTTQASVEMSTIVSRLQNGRDDDAITVLVEGFTQSRGESGENVALLALLIIVSALLAVSAANVSNLLLVRALGRSKTMAIHSALGAGPAQVVAQLFAEALIISFAGAALGLGIAYVTVTFIENTLAGHWGYYWMKVEVDPLVAFFVMALAVLTAIIAGTVPAVRAIRSDLAQPLRQETSGSGGGKPGRVSWALVSGQVSFSIIALIASVLMTTGLWRTRSVNDNFPANSLLVSSVTLEGENYEAPEQRYQFARSLLSSLARNGSYRLAALSTGLPGLNAPTGILEIDGRVVDPEKRPVRVMTFGVTEDYFAALGIDRRQGRLFQANDHTAPGTVVIVSDDFAANHFPDEDPIGRHIRVSGITHENEWARIVGVVDDLIIYDADTERNLDWVYLPIGKIEARSFYILCRGIDGVNPRPDDLRTALSETDPLLPLDGILGMGSSVPMTEVLSFVRIIFEVVGSLALLAGLGATFVAAIGLYGVIAFEVRRKTREIGIRMALGAGRGLMLRTVLREGMLKIAPGLLVGLALAYLITPIFGVFLSGIDPHDPRTFGGTLIGFLIIAFLASFFPALRASGLDPARVFRNE